MSVRSFVTETEPGFLDALNRLAISYRWVSRFIPLDREEARRELIQRFGQDGKDGPLADYVGSLSADMRLRVRDAVELAYLDGEADGPRSYAATAWVVKGTVPG